MFQCFPSVPAPIINAHMKNQSNNNNNNNSAKSDSSQFFAVPELHHAQQQQQFLCENAQITNNNASSSIEETIQKEILNLNMQLQMHRSLKMQQMQLMQQQQLYSQPLLDFYQMSLAHQMQQQQQQQQQQQFRIQQQQLLMGGQSQQQMFGIPLNSHGFMHQSMNDNNANFLLPSHPMEINMLNNWKAQNFMNNNNNNNIQFNNSAASAFMGSMNNSNNAMKLKASQAKHFEESSETQFALNEKRKSDDRTIEDNQIANRVVIATKKVCTEDNKSMSSSPHLPTSTNLKELISEGPKSPEIQAEQSSRNASATLLSQNSMTSLKSIKKGTTTTTTAVSAPTRSTATPSAASTTKSEEKKKAKLEKMESSLNSSDQQSQQQPVVKKEYVQNDSNYTKNLLKGFRRHMGIVLKNDAEALEKFSTYFSNNTLSNEFILVLIHDSEYTDAFNAFMGMDPDWWIKEAKIKDVARQLKFFNAVIRRDYSEIRTKRKAKGAASLPFIAAFVNAAVTNTALAATATAIDESINTTTGVEEVALPAEETSHNE